MIFNLFKSKPTLKDLIPKGFVDIHSHILPGIDDGAKNINESLKLISKMKNLGFSKIIATPHTYQGLYNNTNESIIKSYEKLSNKFENGIKVCFASEYLIDETIMERIKKNEILCLKDKFLLLETSFIDYPLNLYDIIFEIKLNGYIPVIAHPERYIYMHNDFKSYYKLKKMGCKFQLNLLSLTGFYGKDIRIISKKMINKNLIDFAGSDIHNLNHILQFDKKIDLKNFDKLINILENTKKTFK
tara:strand:+ start:144 stop:875 length:732 start_codon:yes stop_codon:yes gene_type:complete